MKYLLMALVVYGIITILSDSSPPPCHIQLMNEFLLKHDKTATLKEAALMNSIIIMTCQLTNGNTQQARTILRNEGL